MKRLLALILSLALLSTCAVSLAETAILERTPAEKELDALVQAHYLTKDLPASLGTWEESPWYQEWLSTYDLAGDYHPSTDYGELAEEVSVCDVAYEAWLKLCGIGNDNDFSLASEAYLFEHVLDGVSRQLWLVIRIHDDMMPDFYILIDRDTQTVLATSDVAVYQEALEARAAVAKKEREKATQVTQDAKALLLSLYGPYEEMQITPEVLEKYEFSVSSFTDDLEGKWYICAYAPVDLMETCPDFYLTTDASARLIYSLSMSFERRESEKEWARQEQKQELLETLGAWGQWSIEEKAQYAEIYNGQTCYGVPGENDLSYEDALKIAGDTLLKAYPEQLTQEMLDNAVIEPSFFIEPTQLYGTVYDAPFYYLTFLPEGNESFVCYEVILDGRDGHVYLIHDPATAGNG